MIPLIRECVDEFFQRHVDKSSGIYEANKKKQMLIFFIVKNMKNVKFVDLYFVFQIK